MKLKPPGKGIVIYGKCSRNQKPLGIRFENRNGTWVLHWSFRTDENSANIVQKGNRSVSGQFDVDDSFRGCPYCGSTQFVFCSCEKVMCWDGKAKKIRCPSCNTTSPIGGEVRSIKGGAGR